MNKFIGSLIAILFAITMTGCAVTPKQPIAMDQAFLSNNEKVIGVIVTPLPEMDMAYPGASCLLCYGTAAAMNSSLSSHADTISLEELEQVKHELISSLSSKGHKALLIEEEIVVKELASFSAKNEQTSDKDFSKLASKHNVSHLLVVDITFAGFVRDYSSYVPVSEPRAQISGTASVIDGSTNAYLWYLPLNIQKNADGEWDEPDLDFPGLTDAFYQAIESTKTAIKEPVI
ncbi:MAG: hypothetical protein MK096_06820 [Oleiphilaceae bacterium]|nr:hypothetical protein [Oleiphilaceae bacterium]